jgi:CRP-like cAMP-binding protein
MSEEQDWKPKLMKSLQYFEGYNDKDIQRVINISSFRKFSEGSSIVKSSAGGRQFFVVLKGSAKVVKNGGTPMEVELDYFDVNSSFGDVAFLLNKSRSADVIASEECIVCVIDGNKIDGMNIATKIKLYQSIARNLARQLLINTMSR